MAYQKRNFKKDQLLTADDLNAMDDQIASNEESAKKANDDIKNKLDKSAVVKEKGDSETAVMSQAAATVEFDKLSEEKADNVKINRFFDNDFLKGQSENLYPHIGKSEFNYPTDLNVPYLTLPEFELEAGEYHLILTEVNANIVFMTKENDSDPQNPFRLININKPKAGVYDFKVVNRGLCHIHYGTSYNNPVEGHYSIGGIYIIPKDSIKIPKSLLEFKFSLTESDEIKNTKGENISLFEASPIEFDGVSYNKSIVATAFMDAGDYLIKLTNLPMRVLIVDSDNNRLLDVVNPKEDEFYKIKVDEYRAVAIWGYMSTATKIYAEAGTYQIKDIVIYKDDGKPFLPDYLTRFNEVLELFEAVKPQKKEKYLTVKGDMTSGTSLEINSEAHTKKNDSYVFTGNVTNFNGLIIGKGKNAYGGTYVDITSTHVMVYSYYSEQNLVHSVEHGLSISQFVNVNIVVGEKTAKIIITTAGGDFILDNIPWSGCNGKVFAESVESSLTDCVLSWTCSDIDQKIWMFGDSYFGMGDQRTIGQLFNKGYHNFLASGFPGGTSSAELNSLRTLITLGTPDIVVWCLGMNDGDSGAVNASWLQCLEDVKRICSENNITLILATIPTCPIVDNTYKNDVVRNSGYRYVDSHKAVGVNGTTWYDGMLASDKVHPTVLGAKVLSSQLLVDVPEIMMWSR